MREVRAMLSEIDKRDRIKFCKNDYDSAIVYLKRQKVVWSTELFKEAIAITKDFFDIDPFKKLPLALHQEIFLWLPLEDYCNVACISSEWLEIVSSNEIWSSLYLYKFIDNNPGSMPATLTRYSCFKAAFQDRLAYPHLGDKVEVSWKGKFRLETQDVYQGLAWWLAEIVDKHRSQDRYKIHYPGWESRWDEWVPRSRLRWMVRANTLESILPGDIVELWCCGQNVPGTWLECKVKKIRGRRYCLGRVLSSGYVWVDRDRLRLVRRGLPSTGGHHSNESSPTRTPLDRARSHRLTSLVLSPISYLFQRFSTTAVTVIPLVAPNNNGVAEQQGDENVWEEGQHEQQHQEMFEMQGHAPEHPQHGLQVVHRRTHVQTQCTIM